jgi:hypothetical protein
VAQTPRIFLVNPPVYDFAAYDFWLKPCDLLSVAGYLRGKVKFALFDYLDRLHPLFHNKTAFPIILLGFDESNRLKDLQRQLNRNLDLR